VLLVRAPASIGPVAQLIEQLGVMATDAGVFVITPTTRRAEALRVQLRDRRSGAPRATIETSEAFARRILRDLDPRYRRGLRVISASEQRMLMREILLRVGLPATSAAVAHSLLAVSRMKSQPIGQVVSGFASVLQHELLTRYDRALQARRAVDPADLRARPLGLLRQDPSWVAAFRRQAPVLIADDYGRLSLLEIDLVHLLASDQRGLVAVVTGPGAEHLDRFRHDFPDAVEATLPLSSKPEVATKAPPPTAAASPRRVLAAWPSGDERLIAYQATDEIDEARFVAAEATRLRAGGHRLAEMVATYRSPSAATTLEDAFRQATIPISRLTWRADDAIRQDVWAYLRLVADVDDDAAFTRALLRPPRGVPATALARLSQMAGSLRLSLAATIPHAAMLPSLPARTRLALRGFRAELERWQSLRDAMPLGQLADRILDESGYRAWAASHRSVGSAQQLFRLRLAADDVELWHGHSWSAFVEAIARSVPEDDDGVRLLPWSQLIGRGEYAVVFLTGLEDGAVPHESTLTDETALALERSQFESGVEHARACTFLTYALLRTVDGRRLARDPSRFLPALQPVSV
jgi:DNA helicase-2/ATP-dependent DNA helicase PcrA